MKKLILFGLCILFISIASALIPECQDEVYLGDTCMIITDAGTGCATFDLILENGTIEINDGVTTELIASTGIYNYSYTTQQEGGHLVVCADNSSASFNVINYHTSTQTNVTAVITQGDSAWTTATGFATQTSLDAQIAGLAKGMDDNRTQLATDHGGGSWVGIINETGATCVTVDDKTGYTIINPGNNTGASCVNVDDKIGYFLIDQAWQNETDALNRFNNQSQDRETQFNTANETSSLILEILTDATNGLTAIKNYLVNTIKAGIDGLSIGMDDNRTTSDTEVDRMINVSRDTENLTREGIMVHGDVSWSTLASINTTLISDAILQDVFLANKTITYNYAWDLTNVTTTWDDLGYEMLEIYRYNDTTNKWYLNSTETRRIL